MGSSKQSAAPIRRAATKAKPKLVVTKAKPKPKSTLKRPKPKLPTNATTALVAVPRPLQSICRDIATDGNMNTIAVALLERIDEFRSPATPLLAGIALDARARAHFEQHLDERFASERQNLRNLKSGVVEEVVVGAGLHASIYCAVRIAKGFPPPLVLERRPRVGGIFAASVGASFYLNSRNRPGPLSVPNDDMGALNVLPGAIVQPSDLSGSEYQTNDALAFVIRLSLALNARVASNAEVTTLKLKSRPTTSTWVLQLSDGTEIFAKRVVIATGLNEPNDITGFKNNPRVFNFEAFMRHMDTPYPMRGMRRIAVIGGGDGGKTVIEALTGQGPAHPLALTSLDYPETIDWYGCPFINRTDWKKCIRSRYQGIARLLPDADDRSRPFRVKPRGKASNFSEGFETVYIDDIPYDCVIDCTGYLSGTPVNLAVQATFGTYGIGGRVVGKQVVSASGTYPIYLIGPAACLPLTVGEQTLLRGIKENETSLFRYAPRTAMLAAMSP